MKTVRRLLAVLLLFIFGGGMALASMENSGKLMQPAAHASADQTPHKGCSKCGGSQTINPAGCSIFGTCVVGVIPASEGAWLSVEAGSSYLRIDNILTGHPGSPEPFPPRSDMLA